MGNHIHLILVIVYNANIQYIRSGYLFDFNSIRLVIVLKLSKLEARITNRFGWFN